MVSGRKILRKIFIFILLVGPFSILATTFKPVTVDEELMEADGVIIGHFLRSKSVELENGRLATQMIFKMNKEWGMQSDLFGMEEVIVHYPGGKKGGRTTVVEGVPQFVMGEKIALLTKNVNNRYWGLNLGLGAFKIINYGNETLLINSLFPLDTKISQIKIYDFELKVKKLKGSSLKVVISKEFEMRSGQDRKPSSVDMGKKRSVASKFKEEENINDQSSIGISWLVALLAITGGLSRLMRQRKS